jgi:hypothetical protein
MQKEAWELANAGYTVVAAHYNPTPGKSGHLATVRPCGQYSNKKGPVLANVGGKVGDLSVLDVFVTEKNFLLLVLHTGKNCCFHSNFFL